MMMNGIVSLKFLLVFIAIQLTIIGISMYVSIERTKYDQCVLACMADDEDRHPLSEKECEKMCEEE